MIDIYEQVFNDLVTKINAYKLTQEGHTLFGSKTIKVEPTYVYSASKFPCITIEQKNNDFADCEMDNNEKHSFLMFEINIYDNSANRMKNCSKLAIVVNDYMSNNLGLVRVQNEPMPNTADATIYRVLQRYEGYIDVETGKIAKILI